MSDEPCFRCEDAGGGLYRERPASEPPVRWIGLDRTGQAYYACDYCKDCLFDPTLIDSQPKHKGTPV